MTRRCSRCGDVFPLTAEFWTRNRRSREGFLTRCKPCVNALQRQRGNKEYQQGYRNDRRSFVDELKAQAGPCADCGIAFPAVAMDWDHRDSDSKRQSVASMVSQRLSFADIVAEIEKCDLVCSNCHRVRTATRAQWNGHDEILFDAATVARLVDEQGYYRFSFAGRELALVTE